MRSARVAIIGGGLSGLHAAHLLTRNGINDYVLLEARDALGGRIVSAPGHPRSETSKTAKTAAEAGDRFDLGPTWFWPGVQLELDRLIGDLGLQRFEQHDIGDMMVERSPAEPPMRMRGYVNSPPSMRLVGGMQTLTDALFHRLQPTRVMSGQTVRRLRRSEQHVEVDSEDASGRITTWQVGHVLLAMPPRLVEDTIEFMPALPEALARRWRSTPTWMAPHAKYVAIYETAFWREQGLSGEARSARGPLGEIHDASMPGGSAALFGFLAVPARIRRNLQEEVLLPHCRAQLARLFGQQAAAPKAEIIKDWAMDRYIATAADIDGTGQQHVEAPPASAPSGPWQGRFTGIASEWSQQFPGYLAGAVDAAGAGVLAWLPSDQGGRPLD